MSEAGDSIHSLSSCTHIGALKTECKYKISLKSAYLYNPNCSNPAQLVVYGRPDNSAQLWPADDCLHTTIDRGNGEIIDNIIQQPTTPTYQFIKYCSDVLLWPARAHLNICYDQKKARQTAF